MIRNIEISSFIFYTALALITAFLFSEGKKREPCLSGKALILLALLIPTFFAAVRLNVGTDYQTYVSIFNIITDVDAGEVSGMYKVLGAGGIGVWAIAKAASLFGVEAFFGLFQFLTILFFVEGIKQFKSGNNFLIMYVYMLTAYPISLNIVKQSLAVAIVFYALKYVYERNIVGYIIWVMIAITFHSTAIIAIPVIILERRRVGYITIGNNKYSRALMYFALVFGLCMMLRLAPVVLRHLGIESGLLDTYLNNLAGSRNLSFFMQLGVFLIIIYFSESLCGIDEKMQLLIVLIGIGTGLESIGFISVVIKRIAYYYYLMPATVTISMIPSCCTSENSSRKLAITAILVFEAAFFLLNSIVLKQGGIAPYNTVLI